MVMTMGLAPSPKLLDRTDPIATSFNKTITTAALLARTRENLTNHQLQARKTRQDLTSTANLARHPPTMANLSHTSSHAPPNDIRANSTRTEFSTLPATQSPPIFPFSTISERENTSSRDNFQYYDPHLQSSPASRRQFDSAPPSQNTHATYPPLQYPFPIFQYSTTNRCPVYQCEYTGQYFTQNIIYDSLSYSPGGPLFPFIPPYS